MQVSKRFKAKRFRAMAATGVLALTAAVTGGPALASAPAAPVENWTPVENCRTYSSTTVCGKVTLNSAQQACVARSVSLGLTERRAEVECLRFS